MNDPYNLQRFVDAQPPVFAAVIAELGQGRKRGHWMWFIFYILPEDAWYVFPAAVIGNRITICINPDSRRSCFDPFREAWKLMEQVGTGQTCPNPEIKRVGAAL